MNQLSAKFTISIGFVLSCGLSSMTYAQNDEKRLNDTGIYYGGNYPQGINSDCSANILTEGVEASESEIFITQQDCSTGMSATIDHAEQSVFNYKKVGEDGKQLAADSREWHCVIDERSGLMWEVKHGDKTKEDLHFSGDRFTWYNSDPKTNGGNIGDWNRYGAHCHGFTENKPRTYCHVEQFVSRVNKSGLCGFNDWRLPTRDELTSLINFGEFQPAIDSAYFPNTLDNFYWTLNPVAGRQIEAWTIDFEFGAATPLRKTDPRPARLVRDVKNGNNR